MSVPPEDAEPAAAAADDTSPQLPLVQLGMVQRGDERVPMLEVFVTVEDGERAADIARSNSEDEFFDIRGRLLTRAEGDGGMALLQAHGDDDPDGLKRRLIDQMRTVSAVPPHRGQRPPAAEIEATLAWLAAAPRLEYVVTALAAELAQEPGRPFAPGHPTIWCRNCTWIQKMVRSDCCP